MNSWKQFFITTLAAICLLMPAATHADELETLINLQAAGRTDSRDISRNEADNLIGSAMGLLMGASALAAERGDATAPPGSSPVEFLLGADQWQQAAVVARKAERGESHDQRRDREEKDQVEQRWAGDQPAGQTPVSCHVLLRQAGRKWPAS